MDDAVEINEGQQKALFEGAKSVGEKLERLHRSKGRATWEVADAAQAATRIDAVQAAMVTSPLTISASFMFQGRRFERCVVMDQHDRGHYLDTCDRLRDVYAQSLEDLLTGGPLLGVVTETPTAGPVLVDPNG